MTKYGGNTPCIEITSASGYTFILDMGSGAVDLGADLVKRMNPQDGNSPKSGTVLVTHTHWDHIQGMPFFAPFFIPGLKWDVYGPKSLSGSFEDTLAVQMQAEYFPITMSQLIADVNCHDLFEGHFKTKGVTVRTHYLNHTVLTLGYRLESGGVSIAYITDHEPYDHRLAVDGYERKTGDVTETDDDRHVEFFDDVDILIHDCQYTASEYGKGKAGWGHSTVEYVVDVAIEAGVKQLALFHHDPNRTDEQVDELVEVARKRAKSKGKSSLPFIFAAAEGLSIDFPEMKKSDSRRRSSNLAGSMQAPNGISSFAAENVVACLDCEVTFCESLKEELDNDNLTCHLCKDFDSLLEVTEQKKPQVIILNHCNPNGGAGNAVDVCQSITQKMDGWGVNVTFFIIAKTQADLEEGRASSNIVPVNNWITEPLSVDYIRTRIRMSILRKTCLWEQAPVPLYEEQRLKALHESKLMNLTNRESICCLGRIARQLFSVSRAFFLLSIA